MCISGRARTKKLWTPLSTSQGPDQDHVAALGQAAQLGPALTRVLLPDPALNENPTRSARPSHQQPKRKRAGSSGDWKKIVLQLLYQGSILVIPPLLRLGAVIFASRGFGHSISLRLRMLADSGTHLAPFRSLTCDRRVARLIRTALFKPAPLKESVGRVKRLRQFDILGLLQGTEEGAIF